LEVKIVMKSAGYVVAAIVLGYLSTLSQAAVVGIMCTDLQNSPWHGDALPADVWTFDYHTQTLTTNEVFHDICPGEDDPLGCFHDSTIRVWAWTSASEQGTLTVIKNMTNETGVSWNSFIQEYGNIRDYCCSYVDGTAESDRLPQTDISIGWGGSIEFSGPKPVLDSESFTIRFDLGYDSTTGGGKFVFDLTPNPVPEPGGISLFGLGALALLRRRKP
jgi:hypothetical protein